MSFGCFVCEEERGRYKCGICKYENLLNCGHFMVESVLLGLKGSLQSSPLGVSPYEMYLFVGIDGVEEMLQH